MNDKVQTFILPIITLAGLVAAWTIAVDVFNVPDFVLPKPTSVLKALYRGYIDGLYWKDFLFTLKSMVLGYVVGCTVAFVLGSLISESKVVSRLLYPYVVALQSMPKIALAPLITIWFGYELESKIVMVALVCFFPMFINTIVGLRQANAQLIDLMRAFSASHSHIFFRIKVPSAAGHIFAGLQISVVLGLIGAVVAEFVASTRGLGNLINASAVNLDTSTMFAALFSLAVLGFGGSQLIRVLHRKVVFWERGASAGTATSE